MQDGPEGIGGTVNTPVYDSEDTYESPGDISGVCQYPLGYEWGNMKEGPKGIDNTANPPV